MLKIAHISDLHISKISLNPLQIFSKRILGTLNLILYRKKIFKIGQLNALINLFQELEVDHVIVSGDISSTSLNKEFKIAKNLFDKIEQKKINIFFIPGNHDLYTKRSYRKKSFYHFFQNDSTKKDSISQKFSLKNDGIEAYPLDKKWYLVGIDTALATPLISSKGFFSEKVEKNLKKLLSHIPPDKFIILVNHFPFFQNEPPRKILIRGIFLKKIVKQYSNIKLYLHGHTHRHCITDLRDNQLPIILDSGSSAHNSIGSFNFLELTSNSCYVQVYTWEKRKKRWEKKQNAKFYLV